MDREGLLEYIKSQSADWETYTAERYLLLPLPSNALLQIPGLFKIPDSDHLTGKDE